MGYLGLALPALILDYPEGLSIQKLRGEALRLCTPETAPLTTDPLPTSAPLTTETLLFHGTDAKKLALLLYFWHS